MHSVDSTSEYPSRLCRVGVTAAYGDVLFSTIEGNEDGPGLTSTSPASSSSQ